MPSVFNLASRWVCHLCLGLSHRGTGSVKQGLTSLTSTEGDKLPNST